MEGSGSQVGSLPLVEGHDRIRVAARAGVAASTVYRFLSGVRVKRVTERRIRRAIAELELESQPGIAVTS